MARKAETICRQARTAIDKWRGYFKQNIDQYHEMHTFVLGRQWNEEEEDMLKTFKKVPLQFNKLATLVNTLLGEQQQNTPQIEVNPLSNCNEQTVQLRQIHVKDIMLSTDAKTVYQVAAAQAFIGGYGAYCIGTDYSHEKSFDQDIRYNYFKDSTMCYWDVSAEHINKIDGMVCGYLSRMSRKMFRATYGSKVEQNITKDGGLQKSKEEIALAVQPKEDDRPFTWADDEAITIIHHYVRKYVPDMLYKLSNGRSVNQEEMDEIIEQSRRMRDQMMEAQMLMGEYAGMEAPINEPMADNMAMEAEEQEEIMTLYDNGEMIRIEDKREIKRSKIMCYKIAGQYVIEESEIPCEDLPLIFVDQNSYYDKNGKQVCRPFVQDAIDAQRYLNYLGTQSAFILKISRYDQFIGSVKNVQSNDTANVWRNPTNVQGMLKFDESPSGIKPEQLRPPELSASLTQQYERAMNDLYTSTGLYPTRLGDEGNEVSGKAIDARTRQGSYTTYVAFNSINRAITTGGRIVNQMIPRVYDSERVLNLMTPDEGRKNITINKQVDEYGELIENDIRKGEFEVILQAGPSYEGQKEQALMSLNMILQANPSLLNMFADLYAENLPLINTIEIKNRLKTIVPPQVIEAGKTGQMPQEAQQPNAQDQAVMMEAQAKQAQIEIKKQELQMKMQEAQAKAEQMQLQMQMKILELEAELEGQKLRYLSETDRTRSDNAISHADNITKLLMSKMKESENRGNQSR